MLVGTPKSTPTAGFQSPPMEFPSKLGTDIVFAVERATNDQHYKGETSGI